MNKTEIRASVLQRRKNLSNAEHIERSKKIIRQLEILDLFKEAKVVLSYYSHNGEVRTQEFMERWLGKKIFLLPRLRVNSNFIALPFSSLDELEKNRFGIPEPLPSETKVPKPELIIVPGVAFDRRGNRIGMGKGYYDRFLEDKKDIPTIALAYSEQVLDELPKDPYDIPIDTIITENEVIRCQFSPSLN